jgi:amidase
MLSTIVGPDPRVPISYPVDARALLAATRKPSVKGLRIAWGGDLGITPLDHEVRRVCETTLDVFRKLGARVEAAHPQFTEVGEIVRTSRGASMAARHHDKLAQWKPVMQANLVRNIEQGLALTPAEIGQGERLRTDLFHRVRAFMERYDFILTPTAAVPPFPVEMTSGPREINGVEMQHYIQWALLTYAFTVINAPVISVPCGFTRDGLPVGLQIAGRWHDEAGVLRAAAAFEQAAPWADRRPPV